MLKTYQNKWVVSTKRVSIEGEERLEGMLREGAGKGAAVICHPHPLYGGSMWNNVVDALESGFFQAGFTTLKFNFRGVGGSTGRYDGGAGEMRDAAAACLFLKEHTGRSEGLVLAGYSFGAWVCARAGIYWAPASGYPAPPRRAKPRPASRVLRPTRSARFARFTNRDIGRDIGLCLVAYPFSVYRSDELRAFRGKICFIGGSLDEISPLDALLALYRELSADKSLKVVPSAHTFDGEEPEIAAFIREVFGEPSEAS